MAVPLEKFVQQLEDSGILASDTIKDFIPPKASPKDAVELARELVRKKKLTKFQAEEVSKGKGKSLVLGNYVLMEKIGAGGMGQVFKAYHRRMDRFVAVKLLPPAMTENEAAIARFEREVKAAAKISHPNIVAAHDADCANGVHFLVMELVEGSDLSAVVKYHGRLSVDKAVNYVLQAAKGLEAAHKKGIVHRDIKPANLLLDKEGTVKILDMGLARLSLDGDDAPQADLTSTGTIMGTVDYMAPEQALDTKAADARADIYALGCSLFFLLTGKATYEGDTLMKKLLAHRDQPIPALRTIRPEVTEQLEAVFRKLVAKKVEDRYQSMTEVIVELERCTAGPTTSVFIQQQATTTLDDVTFDFLRKPLEEPTILAKAPAKAAQGKTGNGKKMALIGAAVLGVLILAGIIVSLKTKDGTLIVEVDQPDAMVQVLDAAGKVEISQKGGKGLVSISVDPGKHRLQIEKDGFTVFGQDFEMKSGGKTPIKAKLVPLEEKPAMVGAKPAPVPAGENKLLAFQTPGFDKWVKEVAALPAEEQVEVVSKKLVELNPGFDGKVMGYHGERNPTIEGSVVTGLRFMADNISDLSPVRALAGLKKLDCCGRSAEQATLADLSPLRGLKLTELQCSDTKVSDLSPLSGMKLTMLRCKSTLVSDLSPLKGMELADLDCSHTKTSELSPLEGMPLVQIGIAGTLVSDLSPLKGMQLQSLHTQWTAVSDLSPLKGMPLHLLACSGTNVSDLSPLQNTPVKDLLFDFQPYRDTALLKSLNTLVQINGKPAQEFWKEAEAQQAAFEQWTKDVAAMPAEQQVEAVSKKLVELNPGFDGKVTPNILDGVVAGLTFLTDNVTDISPVRALAGLKSLQGVSSDWGKGVLADLSPIKGMLLTRLDLRSNRLLADISPLQGMPLTRLDLTNTQVINLSPLKDMALTELKCQYTQVSDLSPLKGMPLVNLLANDTQVSDLSALKEMPLKSLILHTTLIADLSSLESCKSLMTLSIRNTKATPAGVAALQKALPNCKIEWDDPAVPKTP